VFDTADSDDRLDLVCVKLSQVDDDSADDETRDFKDATTGVVTTQTQVKKRKVKCEFQTVKGTPGVSPSEPSVPSGYVKLYTVLIRGSYAGLLDPTQDITDHIYPMGFERKHMLGRDTFSDLSSWTVDANLGFITTASETGANYLIPFSNIGASKLLRVRIGGRLSADSTVKLIRFDATGGTVDNLTDLTSAFSSLVGTTADHVVDIGSYGPLYWANGYKCSGTNPNESTFDNGTRLGLAIANSAATATLTVRHVGFDILVSP
jgi:hypothetical protein